MADDTKAADNQHGVRGERATSLVRWLLLALIPLFGAFFIGNMPSRLGFVVWREQYAFAILTLGLAAAFLRAKRPPWYDLLFAVLALLGGIYSTVNYPRFLMLEASAFQTAIAVLFLLLVLEASRRLLGNLFFVFVSLFVLYARFGELAPGVFQTFGIDWYRLVNYLHSDTSALVGSPLAVAVLDVLPFVVFGAILARMGGGEFFIDLAMSAAGRFRGGAAKVSIVASSLFGSISGSAVANVVSTGVFTIPLMKRSGFSPATAAAIEAVASTGGQLMPPVMGAAAFLMADFIGIPYSHVILAALLPALLFYVSVFVQVHLHTLKLGLRGLEPHEIPTATKVLREGGYFLIPLILLVVMLFTSPLPVGQIGLISSLLLYLVSLVKAPRRWYKDLALVLEDSGRNLLPILLATAAAGLIVGVINLTGVGFAISNAILQGIGANLLVVYIVAALIALVLGIGMPTTAAYILVATLIAPTLISLGAPPVGAHLFLLYFAMVSMITPPVNVAVLTAAPMAGSNIWQAGFMAVRLGIVSYLIPFSFIYDQSLLLGRAQLDASAVSTILLVLVGILLVSVSVTGYLSGLVGIGRRIVMFASGLMLLLHTSMTTNLIALLVAALTLLPEILRLARQRQAERGARAES